MEKNKRNFIISELMKPGFIEDKNQEIILEETEDSGRSELRVWLESGENLCIANADKKKTELRFFQEGRYKSMYKRVDHIIFEQKSDHTWKLHLIEMKGSVGKEKWDEIKGKFRASYLIAQAIAGMLEMDISETVMYTTFEKVHFSMPDTMPASRRTGTGRAMIRMEEEWNGIRFGLNFGERISFLHIPIQMERNKEGILSGNFEEASQYQQK